MTKREELTGLTLMTALLALLAIPTILGTSWEIGLGLVIFSMSIYLGLQFLGSQFKKFALVFLVIAIIFNPLFIINQLFTMTVIDLFVAFTLFVLALYLSKSS